MESLISRLTKALDHAEANDTDSLKNLIDAISTELNPDRIQLNWHVEDVLSHVPRLTHSEALEVLHAAKKGHDACNGICWDTFDTIADNMFPTPNRIEDLPKVTLIGYLTGSITSSRLEAAIGTCPEDMTYEESESDNLIHHYFATPIELEALDLPNSRLISGFTITGWELSS